MIALPGQLFFTTQIPVCLWFISKSKHASAKYGYRDRQGETLFIDARNLGTMISRTQKNLQVRISPLSLIPSMHGAVAKVN